VGGVQQDYSEFPRPSGDDNRPIARPNVLIVTPHPVIGAGIETVLRLEDLYEVRRAGTLADAANQARSWPASTALIDGVLIEGTGVALGIPCVVLSGDAESGQRLAAKVPDAHGWLLKDAPPDKLIAAIDGSLGIIRVGGGAHGTLTVLVAVVIAVLFVGALGLFVWRFFLS